MAPAPARFTYVAPSQRVAASAASAPPAPAAEGSSGARRDPQDRREGEGHDRRGDERRGGDGGGRVGGDYGGRGGDYGGRGGRGGEYGGRGGEYGGRGGDYGGRGGDYGGRGGNYGGRGGDYGGGRGGDYSREDRRDGGWDRGGQRDRDYDRGRGGGEGGGGDFDRRRSRSRSRSRDRADRARGGGGGGSGGGGVRDYDRRSGNIQRAPPPPSAPPAAAPPPPVAEPPHHRKKTHGIRFDWDAGEDTTRTALAVLPAPARRGVDPLDALEARARARAAEREVAARAAAAAAAAVAAAAAAQPAPAPPRAAPATSSHWSDKSLHLMSERDWRIFREDFDIHIKGGKPVLPLRFWDEAGLHPALRRAVADAGYKDPSPIQRQAIPMGMGGRDLIGIAETGSGKTAAFLLPLLHRILALPAEMRARVASLGPLAVVLAPTRELAQQIEAECVKLAVHAGVRSLAVVGGVDVERQSSRLREGVDVVIATPGRLIDLIESAAAVLHQCDYVVLDEADRMIDMGFEPQVSAVMDAMGAALGAGGAGGEGSGGGGGGGGGMAAEPPPAQRPRTTHMFTATMPPAVERLAKKYLTAPATVRIGDEDSGRNKRIQHELVLLGGEGKKKAVLIEKLHALPRPVIVFLNAKKQCDVVSRDLEQAGFAVGVLHSGMEQGEREAALSDFKGGNHDVLVATDVAGRGLDIPDVAAVINYDMSSDIAKFTHRVGRTGRAGKNGVAITLLCEADAALFGALKAYLDSVGQTPPGFLTQREGGGGGGGGSGGGGAGGWSRG